MEADALTVTDLPESPTTVVANLPTTCLCRCCFTCSRGFDSWDRGLVMVQSEVTAGRLVAQPGSRSMAFPR